MAEAPRPLTIAHQGLAACLAVVCVDVVRDGEVELAIEIAGDILPEAHGDGPMAEALVLSARDLLAAWPDRLGRAGGALRWTAATEAAREAVRAYYRARAAACHDRMFPQSEAQGSLI